MTAIKKTLALSLILASLTGFSQKSIKQDVTSENGKIKIHVEKEENGKKEVFDKTYNVEGMNTDEKQSLIDKVTDSLTAGSGKNMKMRVKVNRDMDRNKELGMDDSNRKGGNAKKKVIIKKLDKDGNNISSNEDIDIDQNIEEDIEINLGGMDFDLKDFENKMGDLGKTLKFKFEQFGPMMKKFGDEMEPSLRKFSDEMEPQLRKLEHGDFFNFEGGNMSSKTVKSLNAFPNKPNNNKLNIRFVAPEKGDVTVTVTDIKGKEIGRTKIADFTGEYIGQVDLKGEVKGTVFVTVVQGEDGTVKRVVLN
jgi:hypothetical protein